MKSFLGKKLLFITAHPDDESYVAAGTIYKNYEAGGKNMLVSASFGEKGKSHLKKPLSVAQLKKVRKRELLAVGRFLHISPIKILGLPDGRLKQHTKVIFSKGVAFIKKYKPEIIVSFGKDGISGHYDHITVGRIAERIAKKLNIPFIAFTIPPKITKNAIKWLKSRRTSKHYRSMVVYKKPTIKISIDPKVKKRALKLHKSQMDDKNAFTGFPEYVVKELLKAEYFVS